MKLYVVAAQQLDGADAGPVGCDWRLIGILKKRLDSNATRKDEREIADYIDDSFKGFGPKQSRNFLQ